MVSMVAYGYGYGDVVAAAAVRRAHVDFVHVDGKDFVCLTFQIDFSLIRIDFGCF